MPSFGYGSLKQLDTCHPLLQKVLNEAIKTSDFTILEGYRGEAAQNKAFAEGKSKKKWPEGKHNEYPSKAVDIAPYPLAKEDWNDSVRFGVMIGHVQSAAKRLGIQIRWGGDWDQDGKTIDEKFRDLGHIELI